MLDDGVTDPRKLHLSFVAPPEFPEFPEFPPPQFGVTVVAPTRVPSCPQMPHFILDAAHCGVWTGCC